MKKTLLLSLIILISTISYAQSAKQMLAEIDGHWELDDNNNVTVVRIIEAPKFSKDEIFNRALNFFTYNYNNGKDIIQTQDKESGLVVGKGVFPNIHKGVSFEITYVNTWHVLRVDAKDGRARAIITLTDYDKIVDPSSSSPSFYTVKIADTYPINPKGSQKTVMTKAFYKSYHMAFDTLDVLEKTIKDGSTFKEIENEDW